MTIHDTHPFAEPSDPLRRLRARVGGRVTVLTTGTAPARAGLTVSSLLVAAGEQGRVLALVDPDSDLTDRLLEVGTAVCSLLSWPHRGLAEAFAGLAPAPGGPFRLASWEDTAWGPALTGSAGWVGLRLDSTREVGWSALVELVVEHVELGDDLDPLLHRRGRYERLGSR